MTKFYEILENRNRNGQFFVSSFKTKYCQCNLAWASVQTDKRSEQIAKTP